MSVGKIIVYSSIIVILLIVLLFVSTKGPSKNEIERKIFSANFCGSPEDCVAVETKCPFDCHIMVNKGSVDQIDQLIAEYDGKEECVTKCTKILEYTCALNRCRPTKTE